MNLEQQRLTTYTVLMTAAAALFFGIASSYPELAWVGVLLWAAGILSAICAASTFLALSWVWTQLDE